MARVPSGPDRGPSPVRAPGPAGASVPARAQRRGERPVVRVQACHLPGELLVWRPRFSWTRIKGESDVEGGGGHGWVEASAGSGVGAAGHCAVLDALLQVQPAAQPGVADQLARVGFLLEARPQQRRFELGAMAGLLPWPAPGRPAGSSRTRTSTAISRSSVSSSTSGRATVTTRSSSGC